jgi:uncharacterized membrane protein YfcA
MVLVLIGGLLIGLAVGTVGGGGAVLAVPVLVYAVGLGVHEATTVSLAVVSGAAAVGGVGQARRGAVCWSSAAWFALAAAGGAVLGTVANGAIGGPVLLALFAAVMLLAAWASWRRAAEPVAQVRGCPSARARLLVPLGVTVGAITGLVGVGGGFVVVPVLAIGMSFGMREAMGTSMVVVAIVSAFGLVAHLAAGGAFDVPVAVTMGGAAVAGALAGPRLAAAIPVRRLGRGFAVLVAAVALGVLATAVVGA